MTKFVHIPSGRLSDLVKYMWFQDGYRPSGKAERVLPGGSSQIILNLGGKRFRHFSPDLNTSYEFDDLILTGVHSKPVFLDSTTRISTIGIVLKEGAIPALLKLPATEFQNQVIALENLSLTGLSELKEKLHTTSSKPIAKLQLIENYLYQLISPSHHPSPAMNFAVDQIRQTNGQINISEILEQTGYSRRWFIKKFRDTVGITPKLFARVYRFQHAVDLIRSEDSPNFPNIALECGYYDQSHFNHDFKDLSGIPPLDYHCTHGEEKNHLSISHE